MRKSLGLGGIIPLGGGCKCSDAFPPARSVVATGESNSVGQDCDCCDKWVCRKGKVGKGEHCILECLIRVVSVCVCVLASVTSCSFGSIQNSYSYITNVCL